MLEIEFIAKHIPFNVEVEQCDAVCAFTGKKLSEGVRLKKIVSGNFTDLEYIKYNSQYASADVYKVIGQTIKSEKGYNSLRNYSYYVDNNNLILLKKEQVWDLLINTPEPPFVLAYTFSNKKHTSFKSKFTLNKDRINIITDTFGLITLERKVIEELCPIVQNWYSADKSMKEPNTFFVKDEILFGTDNATKIKLYGVDKFYKENAILEKYRNTNILKLITRLVNRCVLD